VGSVLKITKLHFLTLFKWQIISCAGVLLLNFLISVVVIRLEEAGERAGGGDFVALVYMPIMGLIFFAPSFRYALSQGISRKKFFLAGILSMAVMSAILAVMVEIIFVINLQVANVWMIYELIYGTHNLLSIIVWEFAALLFLGILGWFICLIYYLGNRTTKILVSVAPFVLVPLIMLCNALVNGAISRALWQFCKTAMGYSVINPNPYIGMANMLAAAVVLTGFIYLLLRRAPIKD